MLGTIVILTVSALLVPFAIWLNRHDTFRTLSKKWSTWRETRRTRVKSSPAVATELESQQQEVVVRGPSGLPTAFGWLGFVLFSILALGSVAYVGWKILGSLPGETRVMAAPSGVANASFPTPPRPSPDGEKVVTKFWTENLPEENPEQMIEICRKESYGFNQFEADGITPLRGRQTPDDIGICQINTTTWGNYARLLGHDLATTEGNLQMALVIRNKCGADEWTASGLAKNACSDGIEVEATTEGWSTKIFTKGQYARWETKGKLQFLFDEGLPTERTISPDPKTEKLGDIGPSQTLRFKSTLPDSVIVTVYDKK